MRTMRLWQNVILAGIACMPVFVYSASDKFLMPVTQLKNGGEVPTALFQQGKHGLSIGTFSTIIDTKSLQRLEGAPPVCPTEKSGLTDGYQLFTYSLTNDAAAALSFWGKAEIKASDKVVLYQFAWYKDVLAADASVDARCGAGVMLALKISDAQANASLELPTLAATAQLGQSAISYKINTFGLSGPAIDESIPSAAAIGKFNTESYAALMQSIGKIQDSYKAPAGQLTVTPRLIARSYPGISPGFDTTIAAQAFALRQVASGKKCRDAKMSSPDNDAGVSAIIENVYTALAGKGCGYFDGPPSGDAQGNARALLAKYGLSAN